jgi:WD40 repeat protein
MADAVAGFPAADGRRPARVQADSHVRWKADIGPVRALCSPPGSALVVAATGDAVAQLDAASGSLVGAPLPGPAHAVAATPLPSGDRVVVTADGRRLLWWNAATGEQIGASRVAGAPVLCLAAVPMPPSDQRLTTVEWLAVLRDGRTMLATGDADGAVVLWDPATRRPVHTLLQRRGRSTNTMTTIDRVGPGGGLELVVVHDGKTIDVWQTASVHGGPSTMAPDARKLAVVGHRNIIGAAAAAHPIGRDRPILLADRNGLVSMWKTYGIRLNDPLPPDPNHRDVVGITAMPTEADEFTVVTASHTNRNLRLWRPSRDTLAFVDLDVEPLCLLHAGEILVVGHDRGLIGLTV